MTYLFLHMAEVDYENIYKWCKFCLQVKFIDCMFLLIHEKCMIGLKLPSIWK